MGLLPLKYGSIFDVACFLHMKKMGRAKMITGENWLAYDVW